MAEPINKDQWQSECRLAGSGSFVTAVGLAIFPECQRLVTRLSRPPSLAEQLDVAQAEAEKHPIRYQQLAAIRFCLRTIIRQVEGIWYDTHRDVTN